MTYALIGLLATLAAVLAMNWSYFARLGWANVTRLVLIWGAIIAALMLILRLFGF